MDWDRSRPNMLYHISLVSKDTPEHPCIRPQNEQTHPATPHTTQVKLNEWTRKKPNQFTCLNSSISFPMGTKSRLSSKQYTCTRLPELPASNITAYLFDPSSTARGPHLRPPAARSPPPEADGGARGMRSSTNEMRSTGASSTPRYRCTRSATASVCCCCRAPAPE